MLGLTLKSQTLNDKWLDQIDKGKEAYAINNYQQALGFFKKASMLIPTDTTAYVYLMDCAYKTQNAPVFYECFDKLALLNRESVSSYNLAINLSIDVDKNYQKAVGYVEAAKLKFPENQDILLADALIYYRYGDFKAAKEKLKYLLSKYPKNKKAIDIFYVIQHDIEKDNDAALATLEEAQKLFPSDPEYPKKEVNIYFETGKLDQAEVKFRKLIELNPNDAKHYYNLSLILYNKGEYQQSVELASKAIELDPNFLDAIFNVGTFFYYRGLKYNQSLDDMSPYQYTYQSQGFDVEQTTKSYLEAAKPYFERAIQLNTNELGAFENLNTIKVLLSNIEKNQQLAAPYFSDLENQEKHNVYPDYELDTFSFSYPETQANLRKGQTGTLSIMVSNQGTNPTDSLELRIMQPFINPRLSLKSIIPIQSIAPGQTITISTPVTYLMNNPNTLGVEKAEGSRNLIRFFITSPNGKYTDLKQIDLAVGKASTGLIASDDENSSETIDIDFKPQERATNFLLVIGIDNYKNWPALNNAAEDAKKVEQVLIDKYGVDKENVYELFNQDATKMNIINGLIKIKGELTPHDNLIIYYAGHGDYNTSADEGSWVPVEADLDKPSEYLDNTTLLSFLNALNTMHTFLIADACFSGSLFVSNDEMTYKPNNDKLKSRWGLTSGNKEYVADGAQGEGSPFAQYLVEALNENQRDYITVTELISYVKFKVRNTNLQTPIGRPLRIDGNEGGEFLLYTR